MKKSFRIFSILFVILVLLSSITFAMQASAPSPLVIADNQLEIPSHLKSMGQIKEPVNGTYRNGAIVLIVTFSNQNKHLEFSSNAPIYGVLVKSKTNGYLYQFDGTKGMNGLYAPESFMGDLPPIGTVEFFSLKGTVSGTGISIATPTPQVTVSPQLSLDPYRPSLSTYTPQPSTDTTPSWDRDRPSSRGGKNTPRPRATKTPQLPSIANYTPRPSEEDPGEYIPRPNVIEYFNGVTLSEAIKSNGEIDNKAVEITRDLAAMDDKAKAIYTWVSQNITYDHEKAAQLDVSTKGMSSGAISAFTTKKGVCFDYSCLYIAMCKTAGVKVRLITGQGYNGSSWQSHAWNQSRESETGRWINVDTTFGHSAGNYFDRSGFSNDHKNPITKGQW